MIPFALLQKLGSSGFGAVATIAAFVVTVALVAFTVRVCRSQNWVANPRADRWHRNVACLFGGVPVWISVVSMSLVLVSFSDVLVWKLITASTLMFALGLADDIWHLRPRTKLLVQVAVATWMVHAGLIYPLVQNPTVNELVSLIWIVGITNAFNLLDNMDGLTSGIALISAAYLAAFFLGSGASQYASLILITAGAAAGFLVFNFNPARIFMGDSGSLALGFLLGGSSLLQLTHVSGVPALVFAPALVLAIPVFDTFFVSVTRRLRGQAVSQGGTDHSSHRLVRLGLSERRAVLLLYGLSIVSGAVALSARHLLYWRAISLVGGWSLFLLVFGIHLFRTETTSGHPHHSSSSRLLRHLLVRDSLAFLLDPVVLSLSYYLAYFFRFSRAVPAPDLALFFHSWPLVLAMKFICLAISHVYEHSWWRGTTRDVYRLAQAIVVGEAASVLVLIGLYRFAGFSRAVFLLDAVISWLVLVAIRKSSAWFRESLSSWMGPVRPEDRRVFVLGTSEHTEVALRFLRDRRIVCAGLIDTNGGADVGRWVWGSRVLGSVSDLPRLTISHGICEVVLPQDESLPYSDLEFSNLCQQAQLSVVKLGLFPADGLKRPDQDGLMRMAS